MRPAVSGPNSWKSIRIIHSVSISPGNLLRTRMTCGELPKVWRKPGYRSLKAPADRGKQDGKAKSAKPGVRDLRHRGRHHDSQSRRHVLVDGGSDDAGEGWVSLAGRHPQDSPQSRAQPEAARAQRARRAHQ